jgi:hypothetical protein
MAKSTPEKEIELHPDAWQRFERAAGVVAKSPPQHRAKAKAKSKRPLIPRNQPKKKVKKP